MSVYDIVLMTAKYLLLAILAFIIYQAYILIFKPWRDYRKYSKYPNVEVWEKFYPLLGDFGHFMRYKEENKWYIYDFFMTPIERPEKDVKLSQFGPMSQIDMLSIKAFEEFEKLVPEKIDRYHCEYLPIWYWIHDSMLLIPTTEDWKNRRGTLLKLMGLSSISEYLPMIVQWCDDVISKWKIDEHTDFTSEAKHMSFKAITQILYGTDIVSKDTQTDYSDYKTGEVTKQPLENMLINFARDALALIVNPLGRIFPFIRKYKLLEPYRSLTANSNSISKMVEHICETSNDKESIYNKALATGNFKKVDILRDISGLMFAGTDTTADGLASSMYFLKKNPNAYQRLMKEMKLWGLDVLKQKDIPQDQINDIHTKIQEWDYLNYVVKEMLRLDSPGGFSIKYQAKQDITICGVDIPKGMIMSYITLGPQHDPKQWYKPLEFIPERYEPENEYFCKPDEPGKSRHPKSWVPFSNGIRTCPGKALAMFEIKVLLARLLHRVEYEIDEALISNNTARFTMNTQYHVEGKVTKLL